MNATTPAKLMMDWSLSTLRFCGYEPVWVTRLIVLPMTWHTMGPLDDMGRLVVEAVCVHEERSGKLSNDERQKTGRTYDAANGQTYWAVCSMSGLVFGRSKKKTKESVVLIRFTDLDDACAYAGFPKGMPGVKIATTKVAP